MKGTKMGIVLALSQTAFASLAFAEPSYLLYPNAPAVFRYDTSRYECIAPGDPRFDADYSIGSQMLWDRVEARVPKEIYRAPTITAFEPSTTGMNEFVVIGNSFEIVVDGFGPLRRTIGGLCVRFWPDPNYALLQLTCDGRTIAGLTYGLPPLEVLSAAGPGYFADTSSFTFSWGGASQLRAVAFSDKDGDRAFDGTPRYSIVARDQTVPVSTTTWGRIKALYNR